MKQVHTEHTCALCTAKLKWWNAQSCMDCGRSLCSQHACALKRPHSSVLQSYCIQCSSRHLNETPQIAIKQATMLHLV
jgi:hypothetical protein